MTVSKPERPLNLPFPSHSNIKEVNVKVSVEEDGRNLPSPETLKVSFKGCYGKILILWRVRYCNHEIHEICNSVMSYLVKNLFADTSRKCVLPSMIWMVADLEDE